MGRRGRKRRLVLEDEYWQLVRSGIGTVEACRRVGIGRKTGFRWRSERGGSLPVRLIERELSGRYLTLLDRHRIGRLWHLQPNGKTLAYVNNLCGQYA